MDRKCKEIEELQSLLSIWEQQQQRNHRPK
jgi:hypothetical protein